MGRRRRAGALIGPQPPPIVIGASFPGAQGSGAAAAGGRSSSAKVYEVTNLSDSGNGSLRAALAASGPRYVVFRTGGIIPNLSDLRIGNPFVTVAGRTAPGGGITVGGKQQIGVCLFVNCSEVILLDLTYDGSAPTPTGPSTGTVGFQIGSGNIKNVVFAHLSARWQGNKNFLALTNDAGPVCNISVQNCLMYEPNAQHPVGPMTDATTGPATGSLNLDFHHNLHINVGHRIPLWNTKSGRWQNNIAYNWDWFAALFQGGCTVDIISNYYVRGNLNVGDNGGHPSPFEMSAIQSTDDTSKSMPGPGSFYVAGNYDSKLQINPKGDQSVICGQVPGEGDSETGPIPPAWFRSAQLPAPKYPIVDDSQFSLATLESMILPTVGNSIQLNGDGTFTTRRDPEDQRVIQQYIARGPGNFFTGQFDSPAIAAGTPWPSTQHDGIADQWKQLHDLDTSDPALYNKISPNAGIPYIECFFYGVTP